MAPRVALIASARSGSSWLASLLASHPAVRFHGELFNLEHAPLHALQDPFAYLDERLGDDAGVARVGFRLLQHQARPSYLDDFLAELDQGRRSCVDWRRHFPRRPVTAEMLPALPALWQALCDGRRYAVIHLQRRNLLRQHLSHQRLMAESRARWCGSPAVSNGGVTLAAERLVERFEQHSRAVDALRAFFAEARPLEVAYEDLLDDPAGEQARILRFLDLPPAPLRSTVQRPAPRPLREAVINYGAVARALAGTRWAALLDER
jgi:LPS sulfotransferase NodH